MSIQQGIRLYSQKGKDSVIKELINLDEKNSCFGEIDFELLTEEMKAKALPLLLFMVMKRSGDLKTRGVANGNKQRVYTDKDECSSPTPDFFAFKYLCALFAKEERDVATIDLPGFFLQTKNEGEEPVILRITGAAALLLVESNPTKWRKHLRKENDKWIIYATCD